MRIVRARHAVELPCRFHARRRRQPLPVRARPALGDCTCEPAAVRALRGEALRRARRPDRHRGRGRAAADPSRSPSRARARRRSASGCWRRASASGARNPGARPNAELAAAEIDIDVAIEARLAAGSLKPGRLGGPWTRAHAAAGADDRRPRPRRASLGSRTSRRRCRCAAARRRERPGRSRWGLAGRGRRRGVSRRASRARPRRAPEPCSASAIGSSSQGSTERLP